MVGAMFGAGELSSGAGATHAGGGAVPCAFTLPDEAIGTRSTITVLITITRTRIAR